MGKTMEDKIAEALNGVSSFDLFEVSMGKVIHKINGTNTQMSNDEAIIMLETRIKVKEIQLSQARNTLLDYRKMKLMEAEEALIRIGA